MFKKCLIGSIILHLVFFTGLELISDRPEITLVAQRQSSSLVVALDLDVPSEPPTNKAVGKGHLKTATGTKESLSSAYPEPKLNLSFVEQTPATVWDEVEKPSTGRYILGQSQSEIGTKDSSDLVPSETAERAAITNGGNQFSPDSAFQPDQPPLKIYNPSPSYPIKARKNNWEGVTVLKVLVQADGLIGETTVIESSGYSLLDKAALKTVKQWRYQPAVKNGTAVACQVRVRVKFILE